MERTTPSWVRRHGYLVFVLGLMTVFMAMFIVAEALKAPLFTDPDVYIDTGSWPVAAAGVSLLAVDVFLPVPASGIMIAHGAAFGFALGAVLSLIGGTAATFVAYCVGRRSQGLVDRLVSAEQQRRAAELLERHGVWAIIVSRPVPMFAETVGILAGTSNTMSWWKVTRAGAIGNLIPAVAYAAVGAYATKFISSVLVFAGVIVLAGLVWLVQRSRQAGS